MSADLAFFDVIEDAGRVRYLSRFRGAHIDEAFGRPEKGKFLDEILPPSYREDALATYQQVLVTRLPVYTVSDRRDCHGRIVHYERLLLPFSRDSSAVDRILISMEAVSPEGSFEHRDLMTSPTKRPAFALCATIQH